MALKRILLSERIQAEKATRSMIPFARHLGKGKTLEMMNQKQKRKQTKNNGFQEFRRKGGGRKRRSTGNVVGWLRLCMTLW